MSNMLNFSEIKARLGILITTDLLSKAGIEPDATDKRAQLYNEDRWPAICEAVSDYALARVNDPIMDRPNPKPRSKPKAEKAKPAATQRDEFDDDEEL